MSFNITPPNATIYRDFTPAELAHMEEIDKKIEWACANGFVIPKITMDLLRNGLWEGIDTCPLCFYDARNNTMTPDHGHHPIIVAP